MSKLYSIYDLQLKQIDWVCNLTDMNEAVKSIRDYAEDDHDTTGISDNDLFTIWEFVLFEHDKKVDFPCVIDYDDLVKSIHEFKIIYPRIINNNINDEE